MKKIISVLIVAVLLLSSIAAIIPTSAASTVAYIPDWLELKNQKHYVAIKSDGTEYDLTTFWEKYAVTREPNLISSNVKADGAPACFYISTNRFVISDDTKYQYEVKVKSNSSSIDKNNFAGVAFACTAATSDNLGLVYHVYGGFDNTNAFASSPNKNHSFMITVLGGDYTNRVPYVGDEYMSDPKYFAELELDDEGFASLKIMYDGYDVTIYAKDTTGKFVQLGETVTLEEGSKVVYGVYNRASDTSNNRTVSLKDAKIIPLTDAARSAIEAKNLTLTEIRDISALQTLVDQANALVESDYTEESWSTLQTALRQAEQVIDDDSMGDDYIEMAKGDLEDALAALEPASLNIDALKAKIAEARNYNPAAYTAITYGLLEDQIEAAEALLAKHEAGEKITNTQITAAINNINSKILTLIPATTPPATDAPSTDAPATDAPATNAPATDAPATNAPATDAPATNAPATDAPATNAPATDAPATNAPATNAPATDAPATNAPATNAPATDAPATNAPATDAPATNAPATDAPATNAPTNSATDNKSYEASGCGGSILATSAVVGIVAMFGTALVIKKKD